MIRAPVPFKNQRRPFIGPSTRGSLYFLAHTSSTNEPQELAHFNVEETNAF